MSNKFDDAVTLDGHSGVGAGSGFVEWRNTSAVQQAAVFVGAGAPVGNLGGLLTANVALYINTTSVALGATVFLTINGSGPGPITWTAIAVP